MDDKISRLYQSFACLLEYPTSAVRHSAHECSELLSVDFPQAGEMMAGYLKFVENELQRRVEEIYTNTFDLQGVCCPYVGHHLFGESYKRSWFMAQLNQGYRERGFSCGTELPDHAAVILRFLAQGNQDEFSQVLLDEGLIPAVKKMVMTFDAHTDHPYRHVLAALELVLQQVGESKLESMIELTKGEIGND